MKQKNFSGYILLGWLLLMLSAPLVTSCDEEYIQHLKDEKTRKEILLELENTLKQEVKGTSALTDPHVATFQYKGHDYALVYSGYGDHAVGGVLHDPECEKCGGVFRKHDESRYGTRRDGDYTEIPDDVYQSEYEKVFGKSSY